MFKYILKKLNRKGPHTKAPCVKLPFNNNRMEGTICLLGAFFDKVFSPKGWPKNPQK